MGENNDDLKKIIEPIVPEITEVINIAHFLGDGKLNSQQSEKFSLFRTSDYNPSTGARIHYIKSLTTGKYYVAPPGTTDFWTYFTHTYIRRDYENYYIEKGEEFENSDEYQSIPDKVNNLIILPNSASANVYSDIAKNPKYAGNQLLENSIIVLTDPMIPTFNSRFGWVFDDLSVGEYRISTNQPDNYKSRRVFSMATRAGAASNNNSTYLLESIKGSLYYYYGIPTFYENHIRISSALDLKEGKESPLSNPGSPATAIPPKELDKLGIDYTYATLMRGDKVIVSGIRIDRKDTNMGEDGQFTKVNIAPWFGAENDPSFRMYGQTLEPIWMDGVLTNSDKDPKAENPWYMEYPFITNVIPSMVSRAATNASNQADAVMKDTTKVNLLMGQLSSSDIAKMNEAMKKEKAFDQNDPTTWPYDGEYILVRYPGSLELGLRRVNGDKIYPSSHINYKKWDKIDEETANFAGVLEHNEAITKKRLEETRANQNNRASESSVSIFQGVTEKKQFIESSDNPALVASIISSRTDKPYYNLKLMNDGVVFIPKKYKGYMMRDIPWKEILFALPNDYDFENSTKMNLYFDNWGSLERSGWKLGDGGGD